MDAVLVVNGIFVVAILIEIVYIFLRACKERDFMQNSKFQASHLNPPEESQQQEERIQLVINITHEPVQQEERTQLVTTIAHEPQQQEDKTEALVLSTTLYIWPQALLNPLTPMISLAILLTVSHTVLVMLVWRIGIRSTYNPLTDIYIYIFYSHHLSARYCIDIVRRKASFLQLLKLQLTC